MTRHYHNHPHDEDTHVHHSHRSHSRHRVTSATSFACSVVNSLFAKGECCYVANQTAVPILVCPPSHPPQSSTPPSHAHTHVHTHTRDHDHKHSHSHESHDHPRSPASINLPEIVQTLIDLAERGAGLERRKNITPTGVMDCPSCAACVTKALDTIPSVTQPKVNAFAAEATPMYDIGTIPQTR